MAPLTVPCSTPVAACERLLVDLDVEGLLEPADILLEQIVAEAPGFSCSAIVLASIEVGSNGGVVASFTKKTRRPSSTATEPAPPGATSKNCTMALVVKSGRWARFTSLARFTSSVNALATSSIDWPALAAWRRSHRPWRRAPSAAFSARMAVVDGVLHLLEGLLARRLDAADLEPDIAAVARRHRVVVDADVGGEGGLEQIRRRREPSTALPSLSRPASSTASIDAASERPRPSAASASGLPEAR